MSAPRRSDAAMFNAPLPAPVPKVSPEATPYWEGTADGRLCLQRCFDCETIVWYPRGLCPECSSTEFEWYEASGHGTIYSFTVVRRGALGPYRGAEPYVLAYVELEEGPRVMTNIVDCDFDALKIGDVVRAVFHPTEAGPALVRFVPV